MDLPKNYRMTNQRRVILDELRKMHSHPTADELYRVVRRIIPHISLGTVYRNLEVLSEMGCIKKIELGGNQKRFDGNVEEHYHVRCVKCNRIIDVPKSTIKALDYSCELENGGKILGCTIHFYGLCERCIQTRSQSQKE